MYTIEFTNTCKKRFKKINQLDQKRIISKLKEIVWEPLQYLEKLSNNPNYKMRIGKYRVIINLSHTTISIIDVGLRKNIYKK